MFRKIFIIVLFMLISLASPYIAWWDEVNDAGTISNYTWVYVNESTEVWVYTDSNVPSGDPYSVFEYFDDFDNGFNTSALVNPENCISVSGGKLKISNPGSDCSVTYYQTQRQVATYLDSWSSDHTTIGFGTNNRISGSYYTVRYAWTSSVLYVQRTGLASKNVNTPQPSNYFAIATWDNENMTLYVNGNVKDSDTFTHSNYVNSYAGVHGWLSNYQYYDWIAFFNNFGQRL